MPLRLSELADDPYWHTLLYYREKGGMLRSDVTQNTFFISPLGRVNPLAELTATVDALENPATTAPDEQIACRFPARTHWLAQKLGLTLPPAPCPALQQWLDAINPASATLVFASAYLNNPSSMFGHTLLRIDAPEQRGDTLLLAYAINYAANTDTTNGLLFAVKGLTGGYPGAFSIMPYYEKVKEYNNLESRDLWEYRLGLSQDEIRQLLRHLWEMRGVQFPYFFFSDNCSYELLGLLETARPGLALRVQFPREAIPADTARAVFAALGLVNATYYRPAYATRLRAEIARNTAEINARAWQLINTSSVATPLPSIPQAQALETAYDDLYYRFLANKAPADTRTRLRSLLVARSQVAEADQRPTVAVPASSPIEAHGSRRIGVGAGVDAKAGYTTVEWRGAYHDLLDPPGGFISGAGIELLHARVRADSTRGRLSLEQFTLFKVDSLSVQDALLKPLSWHVAAGQEHVYRNQAGQFDPSQRHSVGYVSGGIGNTLGNPPQVCFGQLTGAGRFGASLIDGWELAMGPRLGCRGETAKGQWLAQLTSQRQVSRPHWENIAELAWQYAINHDNAARLNASWTAQGARHAGAIEAVWLRYY